MVDDQPHGSVDDDQVVWMMDDQLKSHEENSGEFGCFAVMVNLVLDDSEA